jgi:hypothetical protein
LGHGSASSISSRGVRDDRGLDQLANALPVDTGTVQLQAHLSALMTYRTAADLLEQMFPVGSSKDKETMRRRTLRAGAALQDCATVKPDSASPAIAVTLDTTFIRSCKDEEYG